ncbi:keratin, type I cytoskeletal 9 [Drosophila subpulchrella]|uniref:keratin, type I cytoskeletal 9 n=1 Tax=Drosophila subpulchrella TaxID=1486046 RepID=UPI0018A1A3C0|nr:keratin, type I cytoskeletal 9 [Drosophila subpulchrella]
MRLFVTLCTLVALSQAKPQGYNYGSGVSGSLTNSGSSGSSSGGFLTAPSHSSVASYGPLGAFQTASVGSLVGSSSAPQAVSHYGGGSGGTYSTGGGHGATYSTGGGHGVTYSTGGQGAAYSTGGQGATYSTGGQGATYSTGGASNYGGGGSSFTGFGPSPNIGFGVLAGYQAPSYQQQQEQEVQRGFQEPIIHKQFFTVAAPEEHENLERSKHLVIGRPQKNYRVVFIKAPSSSNANVKLSAEYAPKEEKTVIYVLSKKDNQLEVNDIATPAPTVPSKPEVFFIKYKTDAEASHAQQQIQAEYDRIEGTSEHQDGGVAPAQSVVGILDGGAVGAASTGSSHFVSGGTGSTDGSSHYVSGSTGGSFSSTSGGSTGGISGGITGGSISGGTIIKNAQSATYLPPNGK